MAALKICIFMDFAEVYAHVADLGMTIFLLMVVVVVVLVLVVVVVF